MIETQLAPGLLLAMPHLLDPNFRRAVVLMVEHDEQGSFGIIINQPSPLTARELFSSLDLEWNGDDDAVVWRGGPVMPTYGWVLHDPVAGVHVSAQADGVTPDMTVLESGGTVPIGKNLVLSSGSLAILRSIAEVPPPHVRVILGYAGWGAGQLAEEMARGSWLHADVSMDLVFGTPPEQMWETALRSVGIDPENIVHGAGIN
jgi:putative transcriptional regulator